MSESEAIWTEADQARADLIAEIACEISEDEDVVAMALDAYDARRNPADADAYEALRDAERAIASLPTDALGYADDLARREHWPIREELLHKIRAALSKLSQQQGSDATGSPHADGVQDNA